MRPDLPDSPANRWRKKYPLRSMLSACKARAKKKGIPFDLTEDDLVLPDRCPVLGIELRAGDLDAAPSIDRINPTRGYVAGNVHVISNRANRIKNNGTPAEHRLIAKFFERLDS